MTEKEIKAAARRVREGIKNARSGYIPTINECMTYIRESLAGEGFEQSHQTKCYEKHGVTYCEMVAQWYQLQTA